MVQITRKSAFTIIELFIATSIGAVLIAGLLAALVSIMRTATYASNVNAMISESAFTLNHLQNLVAIAGHHYQNQAPVPIESLQLANPGSDNIAAGDKQNTAASFMQMISTNPDDPDKLSFWFWSNASDVQGCGNLPASGSTPTRVRNEIFIDVAQHLSCYTSEGGGQYYHIANNIEWMEVRFGLSYRVNAVGNVNYAEPTSYISYDKMASGDMVNVTDVAIALMVRSQQPILSRTLPDQRLFDVARPCPANHLCEVVYAHVKLAHVPAVTAFQAIPTSDFQSPQSIGVNSYRYRLLPSKINRNIAGIMVVNQNNWSSLRILVRNGDGQEILHDTVGAANQYWLPSYKLSGAQIDLIGIGTAGGFAPTNAFVRFFENRGY